MNKPPPRRKTTKSVTVRRPESEPESTREKNATEPAPVSRDRKPTTPDLPRARKSSSRADGKAQRGPESARPRRDSRADADTKATEPPRRDTKGVTKSVTVPPPSRRDSKSPKEPAAEAPPATKAKVHAPFRTTGDLPEPEGTRYSVIPSPRTPKKPAR